MSLGSCFCSFFVLGFVLPFRSLLSLHYHYKPSEQQRKKQINEKKVLDGLGVERVVWVLISWLLFAPFLSLLQNTNELNA